MSGAMNSPAQGAVMNGPGANPWRGLPAAAAAIVVVLLAASIAPDQGYYLNILMQAATYAIGVLGLVVGTQATGKAEGFAGIEHKGHQTHHQALNRFGRMLRQRQVMAGVIAAVHVGNRQAGFINGGGQGHE
jgi:hypothetical protein